MRTQDQRTVTEVSSLQGFVSCKIIASQSPGLMYTLKFYSNLNKKVFVKMIFIRLPLGEAIEEAEKTATKIENEIFGKETANLCVPF